MLREELAAGRRRRVIQLPLRDGVDVADGEDVVARQPGEALRQVVAAAATRRRRARDAVVRKGEAAREGAARDVEAACLPVAAVVSPASGIAGFPSHLDILRISRGATTRTTCRRGSYRRFS
jgi:hypothetical protein